ncbi:unnamed protein product, partial [Staurois parvus]
MPPASAHQCHISATYQCLPVHHLSCLSVPLINASQCCQSVPPISASQCSLSVTVSATYQCESVLPISAHQ